MTEQGCTPGPWEVRPDGHVWHSTRPMLLEGQICKMTDPTHPSAKADAYLIAAAPDLLEALERIERSQIRQSRHSTYGNPLVPADQVEDLQRIARQAIAKTRK